MRDDDVAAGIAAEFESIRRAAEALRAARKVLISTGAGMSADSGVPTYRDENGRWREFEPFTAKGLVPREIAHLDGYKRDPALAWGFHEYVRRTMAEATPHRGYRVITRWITEVFPRSFVLTSNIDGLHRRAGVPSDRLWERYGSIWDLQCVNRCRDTWWPAPESPLCQLDVDTMRASELPRCPFCDAVARPRIQLDHDADFIQMPWGAQRYERFIADHDVELYVVIGTTLWFSWPDEVAHRPAIIHINPDPDTHRHYDDPIAITMGAEDALTGMDWVVRRMDTRASK